MNKAIRVLRSLGVWSLLMVIGLTSKAAPEDVFGPDLDPQLAGLQSDWFGTVYVENYPWVYHWKLGWLWVGTESRDNLWLHHENLGWVWTRTSYYPYLYRDETHAWVYHLRTTQWLYDYTLRDYYRETEAPDLRMTNVHAALWRAEGLLRERVSEVNLASNFPTEVQPEGNWKLDWEGHWTSGFWPGCLWYMYAFTGDSYFRNQARKWTSPIDSQSGAQHHDIGFMFNCSFGNGIRIANEPGYLSSVLTAATTLAGEYDPDVQMTRSWSWGTFADGSNFTVIVDNMMNLELLFWASKQPGGNPNWKTMAQNHARRCAQEHVRADHTTYHVVIFDEDTGAVKERRTYQGYDDESTWARGQAWAVYGFTVAYRETGDAELLATAEDVANYFIDNLPPDKVPYWDFEYPTLPTVRDSSAAAVVASALFELYQLTDDAALSQKFYDAGVAILDSLMSESYSDPAEPSNALLSHGTAFFRQNKSDQGLIYGDYYFLEALLRYRALTVAPGELQAAGQ